MELPPLAKNVLDRGGGDESLGVAVAVIDVHGNVVLQHRMNGAGLLDRALETKRR